MYYVFNLSTANEQHYTNDVPKKQALKTSYALANGLATKLATSFEKLMSELEGQIKESKHCYMLGDFTVLKN